MRKRIKKHGTAVGSNGAGKRARFVAELVRNGGNASAAARAVGFHPDHGRRLVSRDVAIQATLRGIHQDADDRLREWPELAVMAQARLVELLDSDDDRVALNAAVHILDRALGKVPQKVDAAVTHRTPALTSDQMGAVVTLMVMRAMPIHDATEYVIAHPEEVREWLASQSKPALLAGQGQGTPS